MYGQILPSTAVATIANLGVIVGPSTSVASLTMLAP